MNAEESALAGRIAALEYLISMLIDHSPGARQALQSLGPGKLEDWLLTQPLSDATADGFAKAIRQMQKRFPAQQSGD